MTGRLSGRHFPHRASEARRQAAERAPRSRARSAAGSPQTVARPWGLICKARLRPWVTFILVLLPDCFLVAGAFSASVVCLDDFVVAISPSLFLSWLTLAWLFLFRTVPVRLAFIASPSVSRRVNSSATACGESAPSCRYQCPIQFSDPAMAKAASLASQRLDRAVGDAVGDVAAKGRIDIPFGGADRLAVFIGEIADVEAHQAGAEIGCHHFPVSASACAACRGRCRRRH